MTTRLGLHAILSTEYEESSGRQRDRSGVGEGVGVGMGVGVGVGVGAEDGKLNSKLAWPDSVMTKHSQSDATR